MAWREQERRENGWLDRAAEGFVVAVFSHAGQRCTARSRLLVQDTIYEGFMERFVEATKRVRVGDPLDERTEMGPVISEERRRRILEYVEAAVEEGARVVWGGRAPDEEALRAGYYLLPTVLDGVQSEMRVAQEEIFGPVVCVLRFSTEEEAVRIANGTRYGLAATVWTRDVARVLRMTRALRAGVVSVNSVPVTYVEAPFGGMKASGVGRELGLEGLLEYTEVKTVALEF